MIRFAALPTFAALASSARAFEINALFSDGMVLQTARDGGPGPGALIGTAAAGATVTLTGSDGFPSSSVSAVADDDGVWTLVLANDTDDSAWGPFELTLASDEKTYEKSGAVVASDVYFGDVYFCGGQSNMERAINTIANMSAELELSSHPHMRLFAVPKQSDVQPSASGGRAVVPFDRSAPGRPFGYLGLGGRIGGETATTVTPPPTLELNGSCLVGECANPCDAPARAWRAANSTWVQHFSALCYMTARDAARDRGTLDGADGRAIGLIEDDFGGTPVQAWAPPEALAACGMPTDDCATEPGGSCESYPSALFNTMVAPVVGRGLRAFLWMQVRCGGGGRPSP